MAAHPLKGRASRATIEEWWEYAHRRCWLEQHVADRYRLTSIGREELRVRREDVDGPDLAEWAKTIVRWTLAGGAIGAAGYLSGKYGTVWLAVLGVCIAIALLLFIAAPFARLFDRPADRWVVGAPASRGQGRGGADRVSLPTSDHGNSPGLTVLAAAVRGAEP